MARGLPSVDEVRETVSDRQVRERSATKRAAQNGLAKTEQAALADFLSGAPKWRRVNGRLARVHGDATQLSDQDRRYVGRLDRACAAYEERNERTHRVYVPLRLPSHINHSNLEGYLRNQAQGERTLEFDKFMMGSHNLHEAPSHPIRPGDPPPASRVLSLSRHRAQRLRKGPGEDSSKSSGTHP